MTSLPAFVKGLGLQLHGKCQGEKRVIPTDESVTAPTFEQYSSIPLSNPYLCFVWSENKHRPENS